MNRKTFQQQDELLNKNKDGAYVLQKEGALTPNGVLMKICFGESAHLEGGRFLKDNTVFVQK